MDKLQEAFNTTRINIMVECKYDKWAYELRLDMLHHNLRNRFKLIDGGLMDESSPVTKVV